MGQGEERFGGLDEVLGLHLQGQVRGSSGCQTRLQGSLVICGGHRNQLEGQVERAIVQMYLSFRDDLA